MTGGRKEGQEGDGGEREGGREEREKPLEFTHAKINDATSDTCIHRFIKFIDMFIYVCMATYKSLDRSR